MNKQRPTLSLKSPAKPAAPKLRASHARDLKPALQTGFNTGLKADSLAYSLIGAAQAVALVRTGTNLPQALVQVWARLGQDVTPQARGAMQVFQQLEFARLQGQLAAVAHHLVRQEVDGQAAQRQARLDRKSVV